MTVLSREEVEALPERPRIYSNLIMNDNGTPLPHPYDKFRNDWLSLFDRVAELEQELAVCIKAWKLADSCTVQERERTAAAEAQVARLREALEPFAKSHDKVPRYEHVVAARAALGET